MRLFLSSRRTAALLAVTVAVAATPRLVDVKIAFPDLIGDGSGTALPLSTIAPLLLAIVLARSFAARSTHLSDYAVRRTGFWDVAVLVATDAIVLGLSIAIPHGDLATARNAILLTGASTLVTCIGGPAAAAATVTVTVLFVVTYGASAPGSRFVRILQAQESDTWPILLAAALTIAAITALTGAIPAIASRTRHAHQ